MAHSSSAPSLNEQDEEATVLPDAEIELQRITSPNFESRARKAFRSLKPRKRVEAFYAYVNMAGQKMKEMNDLFPSDRLDTMLMREEKELPDEDVAEYTAALAGVVQPYRKAKLLRSHIEDFYATEELERFEADIDAGVKALFGTVEQCVEVSFKALIQMPGCEIPEVATLSSNAGLVLPSEDESRLTDESDGVNLSKAVDLKELADSLDAKKPEFIVKCREEVETYVSGLSSACMEIIEKGVRVHTPIVDSYLKVLWKFMRDKQYHGHDLESVLCKPISCLVAESYAEFIKDNESTIERHITQEVLKKVDIRPAIMDVCHDELIKKGIKKGQGAVAKQLAQACHDALQSNITSAVHSSAVHALHDIATDQAQTIMHTALGSVLATSISHAIFASVSNVIQMTITKVAGSAMFHKFLATKLCHSIAGVVGMLMVKMFAAHAGAASGSAVLGPLAVSVAAGVIAHKILTLPKKLGKKLGKAVAQDLEGKFRPWTEQALDQLLKDSFDFEEIIVKAVRSQLDGVETHALEMAFGVDTNDVQTMELEKDVTYLVGEVRKVGDKWVKKNLKE